MSRNFTTCRPRFRGGPGIGLLAGLLGLALLPSLASAQSVQEKREQIRVRNSQFNLAAGPTTVLRVNEFQCGLTNNGDSCTDVFDSPTGGGGFWPTGSPNQYMFNSGLHVTGVIPKADDCIDRNASITPTCFKWSGDTTGAFFFDASGVRKHATAITQIYNSLDPIDMAAWPQPGTIPNFPEATTMLVNDTSLFNDVLIGRQAASQQDTWVMYWDGDPVRSGGNTGRPHPMGILVEQRTLAWNYPEGNEATIYFIYKFTNVTNNALFQSLNEERFFNGQDSLPNSGWSFDSIYVAYDSDPDVGDATQNYASGLLPFNMSIAYVASFNEPSFIYPPDLFRPPFFPRAPGIVAMKYLKSPVNPATGLEVGLTSLSEHTNGGPFPDPSTVQRGWRYISLRTDPSKGDANCNAPSGSVQCFSSTAPRDVRVFIGSGPFILGPGESATIAVSMFAAATVSTSLIGTSPGSDNPPGTPTGSPGCFGEPIRAIEVASGWLSSDCPTTSDTLLTQFDVSFVPNSLLGKAIVAQSIFDNKFLLGFAPEPPNFYLVPGNNRVSVIWERSATETVRPGGGDPFFVAAGDPANPLYDPNYRQYDVEGYRIYRGTSPANMRLIAQFDYADTEFVDVLCVTDVTHVTGSPCTDTATVDLVGDFVQASNVALLANGDPILLEADTALSAEETAGTGRELSDTGVPFAYVDTQVRNGFQYFYEVTAFDINSLPSGPTSLESAGGTKTVIPAAESPNLALAPFSSYIAGSDGEPLNTTLPLPLIDAQDGTFTGPMPPTNAISGSFAPLVERLLPQLSLEIRIDSVVPGYNAAACPNGTSALGNCWNMYMTTTRDGVTSQAVQNGNTPVWGALGGGNHNEYTLAEASVEADPASAAQFGIPAGASSFNAAVTADFYESIIMSAHLGQAISRGGNSSGNSLASPIPGSVNLTAGGSRWFDGANETTPDPTRLSGSGHIGGIDTIWGPESPSVAGSPRRLGTNNACFTYHAAILARAADVQFRWSAAGAEVFDVTHNVAVDFKPSTQASYGFLTTDGNGNGIIDYDDFNYIEGMFNAGSTCSRVAGRPAIQLAQTPTLVSVSTGATTIGTLATTGQGFGIYVNGERYIVQATTLPTAGTWTLRTYQGFVTASSGGDTNDPSGYAFSTRAVLRPPLIPGLRVVFEVDAASVITADVDLDRVHTVPDPYYAVSLYDLGPANKELQFVNLPPKATVRIYSLSGVLVDILNHDDPAGGGLERWDLRNRSNQFVASGVYMFHVSTPEGKSRIGKFTVINSGLGN